MKLQRIVVFTAVLAQGSTCASEAFEGCAPISMGAVSFKIAKLKAQNEWVKANKGVTVSGKETLTLSDKNGASEQVLDQSITLKTKGYTQGISVTSTTEKLIDDEMQTCVTVIKKD
jgi:hypothetical protein